MDCSLPGSSVQGIFQARVLEWGAIGSSEVLIFNFHLFSGSNPHLCPEAGHWRSLVTWNETHTQTRRWSDICSKCAVLACGGPLFGATSQNCCLWRGLNSGTFHVSSAWHPPSSEKASLLISSGNNARNCFFLKNSLWLFLSKSGCWLFGTLRKTLICFLLYIVMSISNQEDHNPLSSNTVGDSHVEGTLVLTCPYHLPWSRDKLTHGRVSLGVSESPSIVSDSLWSHGLYSSWKFPGQNTGVDSHSLLQGILPTQGSNQVFRLTGGFFTHWATRETHPWEGGG